MSSPHPLMQYTQAQPQQIPTSGADKYTGIVAQGYDAKRMADPKWVLEQRIIEAMLDDLPPSTRIIDAPCGTGRFFPFYQHKKFKVLGVDKQDDMINEAMKKITARDLFDIGTGDILNMGLPDNCTNVTVNCRITRWLSPEENQIMLREMQRMAIDRIIWTARIANHPHARSLELFESVLDGWEIVYNEVGSDMDYRILQARPTA
jgi:SAM-dependent methyltransferase